MKQKKHQIPDAAAMARLLKAHGNDMAGLILRLVWRAGLNREEIAALTWDRVDLDAGKLRLGGREVPLEEETARFLSRWRERHSGSGHVAVSRRLRPITTSAVSAAARRALDEEGQNAVRFYDLRHDYVRRQFENLPWHEALRVTGLSVTTYRGALAGELEPGQEHIAPERSAADEEYLFWRVLQAERDTPAGIALWLSNQLGLSLEEIAGLIWEQVDLEADELRLPDKVLPLTAGTRRVLREASARRRPGEDPHVILTPRSRAPMDTARLTTLMRDALVRGGLGDCKPMHFRKSAAAGDALRLLELVRANGSLSRAEAAERLGLSMAQAYDRLRKLEAAGSLVLLKNRWWPAGDAAAAKVTKP